MHITAAGRTDVGVIRSGNEDSYRMVPDRGIFVVADGMGGHAAGEVASEMAVRIVTDEIHSVRSLTDEQVAERMRGAIRTANGAIFQRTLTEHDKRGMGTTVTALTLFENRFLIGQVGDSRAYLLRDNRLSQLTKDHSYVQEQVDAGYLTPEQARTHPYSNVITRCVGANSDVIPDIYVGSVPPILQHAQQGKAKCVLLTSADRIAALPSASGLRDLGIPDEETILWRAVLAPKGTPPAKVAELEAVFEKAANAPATRKFLDDAGEQLLIRKGPALRQYIDKEYDALGKLAKALNLAPQ